MERDTFCSYCGALHSATQGYPRTCPACGKQVWANPTPVAVVLQPVVEGDRTGLLVIRRSIPPVGKLALVGGFVEADETWQECVARELLEEASVVVAPETLTSLVFVSVPYHVLLFSIAPPLTSLPEFVVNSEASERRVIFEPEELAFAAHTEAARDFFQAR